MNIQECIDQLNLNILREDDCVPHPRGEPETWQVIRWLSIELAAKDLCTDNFHKISETIRNTDGITY